MEELPGRPLRQLAGPRTFRARKPPLPAARVCGVSDHRMTDGSQMDPDLMSSTGFELGGQQIRGTKPLQTAEMGYCTLPILHYSHPPAICRVPGDWTLDAKLVLCKAAPGERKVTPADFSHAERVGEPTMRFIVLSDNEESGRILIQAMNDSGSQDSSDTRQVVDRVKEGVNHRTPPMTRSGMHHHARRLVDHQKVFILIGNVQFDRLRLEW